MPCEGQQKYLGGHRANEDSLAWCSLAAWLLTPCLG